MYLLCDNGDVQYFCLVRGDTAKALFDFCKHKSCTCLVNNVLVLNSTCFHYFSRQNNFKFPNAGINFIHNHPPAHPRGFAPKICPHPGAFASKLLLRGRDLLGQLPTNFLQILKFSLQWHKLATDNTLGITCCSKVLYAFKENYSILD